MTSFLDGTTKRQENDQFPWRFVETAKKIINFLSCVQNPPWNRVFLAVNELRQGNRLFLSGLNLAAKKLHGRGKSILV
jgi:hypothetical protein